MSKRCKSHGKLKYYETYQVQSALTHTQKKRGEKGAKRYYKCPDCGAYHLTSQNESQINYSLKHREKWMEIFDRQIEEAKETGTLSSNQKRADFYKNFINNQKQNTMQLQH